MDANGNGTETVDMGAYERQGQQGPAPVLRVESTEGRDHQALQDGEELLGSVQAPESNWHWWDAEQSRLALQEARRLIRPEAK